MVCLVYVVFGRWLDCGVSVWVGWYVVGDVFICLDLVRFVVFVLFGSMFFSLIYRVVIVWLCFLCCVCCYGWLVYECGVWMLVVFWLLFCVWWCCWMLFIGCSLEICDWIYWWLCFWFCWFLIVVVYIDDVVVLLFVC